MDYSKTKEALEKAEAKAKELGQNVSIAIVDDYGDLVAFSRMEGAIKISPRFAITKAFTAGTLGMATADLGPYALEGKPYYGINTILSGELTTIAGGIPIKKGDKLVGGVGVGGSYDVKQDAEIAKIAVEILEK
ncbi:MAG: heme-binding protein [Nanoarchaeota archaeon]|nr:heme-binding protein [Nanoarchaeota archaeon]